MLPTTLFSRRALLPKELGVYGFHYSILHFSQASTSFFQTTPCLDLPWIASKFPM